MPLPPGCYWTNHPMFFDPGTGEEHVFNEGSSSNCDGAEFMRYLANRPEAITARKRAEAREVKASDMKTLGPIIGKLAQAIRKRRAKALTPETRALAKSLRARRRRSVEID